MTQIAIIVLFFIEYLPEDDRKRPKHVGRLPHVCISLFLIIVQFLERTVFSGLKFNYISYSELCAGVSVVSKMCPVVCRCLGKFSSFCN